MGDAVVKSVVTLGDSLLSGGISRRSMASRVAGGFRATIGEPLVPLDLSGGGLSGASRHAPELPALEPRVVLLCLGSDDAESKPMAHWWIDDSLLLLAACRRIAPTVLVLPPPLVGWGTRANRWHSRTLDRLAELAGPDQVVDLRSHERGGRKWSNAVAESAALAITEVALRG